MSRPMAPRLHVLLARDADSGVVIRRGPTRHTAVIGWDRRRDTFTLGQWLYGRIYERRCDLSPDGRHLIYFAMNGRWQSQTRGSWTAISRAPYLKALTLYAKGDCWQGGGLFLANDSYWLNGACMHTALEDRTRLKRTDSYPWHEGYGGECLGVYFIRLQRDGWRMQYTAPDGEGGEVSVFEKPLARHWLLRKFAHATLWRAQGRSVYFDTHELVNGRSGEVIACRDWEWADLDGKRLVWAAEGRLHAGTLAAGGLQDVRELYDFNAMRFERREAPY